MTSKKKITLLIIGTNHSAKYKQSTFHATLSYSCKNSKPLKSNEKYCDRKVEWTNGNILLIPPIFFHYSFSFIFVLFILNLFTNAAVVGLVIVHGAELNLSPATSTKTVKYEFNVKPSLPFKTSSSYHLPSIDGKCVSSMTGNINEINEILLCIKSLFLVVNIFNKILGPIPLIQLEIGLVWQIFHNSVFNFPLSEKECARESADNN